MVGLTKRHSIFRFKNCCLACIEGGNWGNLFACFFVFVDALSRNGNQRKMNPSGCSVVW